MSVLSLVLYLAASVALLALVLECCCRKHLKREHGRVISLVEAAADNRSAPAGGAGSPAAPYPINGPRYSVLPFPAGTPYPTVGGLVTGGPYLTGGTPCPPTLYVSSAHNAEAPPPSYEQVMGLPPAGKGAPGTPRVGAPVPNNQIR